MKSFVSLLQGITYHIMDVGIFINKTINIKLPVRASFPVLFSVQDSSSGIFGQRKPERESKIEKDGCKILPKEAFPKIRNHTISISVAGDPPESKTEH